MTQFFPMLLSPYPPQHKAYQCFEVVKENVIAFPYKVLGNPEGTKQSLG